MLGILLYNLLMLVVVAAALLILAKNRRGVHLLVVLMAVGVAAIVVAFAIGISVLHSGFGAMRLLGHGIFGHVVLVLVVAAALLWRDARGASIAAVAIAIIVVGIGVDAYFIEPHWLEVTHHRIASSKIKTPITVAVLADLQTDDVGRYERQVFERMMQEKPDLILMAGDYLQIGDPQLRAEQREKLRQLLMDVKLSAPLGIFAVQGNVDSSDWTEIFAGSSVKAIVKTRSFDLRQGSIHLTGLSERDSGNSKLQVGASDRFHICLGHRPDFAMGPNVADLLVAGHTHGGQVRLPVVGPLITLSRINRAWAAGLTKIEANRHLLVSRGIGMERHDAPRLRFLCRPELVLVQLVPE